MRKKEKKEQVASCHPSLPPAGRGGSTPTTAPAQHADLSGHGSRTHVATTSIDDFLANIQKSKRFRKISLLNLAGSLIPSASLNKTKNSLDRFLYICEVSSNTQKLARIPDEILKATKEVSSLCRPLDPPCSTASPTCSRTKL
jgi:hypothetical protein